MLDYWGIYYPEKTKLPFMKLSVKLFQIVSAILILSGAVVFLSGYSLPVYTNPDAPAKLSLELQDLPRNERFAQWYKQLPAHETSHKRLTDLGRCLAGLGLGLFSGALLLQKLPEVKPNRVGIWIGVYWTVLWIIKFPLSIWYYSIRQSRFDYPTWGDSIGIGLFQDFAAWVIGYIVSSSALAILMMRHRFPARVALIWPVGGWERGRAVALWLWMLLLLACILPAMIDGDEGMVIPCTAAIPVILLALSANKEARSKEPIRDSVSF